MVNGVHFVVIFSLIFIISELWIKYADERKRKEKAQNIVKEFAKEKRAITNAQM